MLNIKNKIYFITFVILSYCSFTNCLIRIPIKRIKTKGYTKYNKINNKEKSFRSLETIDYEAATLTLGEKYIFLTNIKIGSNNQEFNLILDTTSPISWVALSSSNASQINNYYNPSTSNTSKEIQDNYFTIDSSDYGYVIGNYYTDKLKYIGDQDFIMKFGAAKTVDRRFEFKGADGIIGLGHYYEDDQKSILHMLKKYGITNSTLFSLKFKNTIKEGENGDFYIGKHEDFSRKNSISLFLTKFNDINNASFLYTGWILEISGFSLKKENKELKSSKGCKASFDTLINYIILPYEYLNDILKNLSEIDCSPDQIDEIYYRLKCLSNNGKLPDLGLEINDTSLIIPSNYIFTLNEDYHYSNIYFCKSYFGCDIGAPFFFVFHTLFDRENEQIHFYPNDPKFLEKNGDNKWILISAIAAGIILLIILTIIICCCCIKSKKSKENEDIEKGVDNTDPILENEN